MKYSTDCIDKISTIHKRIYPIGGYYINNDKCHRNALYYARKEGLGIASVICTRVYGDNIAHFVNIDKEGNYIDNTVSDVGIYTKYYLVNTFTDNDFTNPSGELICLKKYIASIYNTCVPRYKFFERKGEDYF